MTKPLLALCLLLFLCSFSRPASALPPFDSSNTSTAAEDATGTVWASGYDGGSYGKLVRWQAGNWIEEDVPGTADFRLRVLTLGGDGSVYALWQQFNQDLNQTPHCLVTVHRGRSSSILARFSGSVTRDMGFPNTPSLYAGSGGDVWVAGYQPLLRHITPDGRLQSFPLTPDQYFDGKPLDQYSPSSIASLVDGAGRRWFWQDGSHLDWRRNGLRGVLIWDGKTLAYHATLTGVPDQPFTMAAPLDANHLWVADGNDDHTYWPKTSGAIYRVDLRTLSGQLETPPSPEAFQDTLQIFRADGEWYAVEKQQYGSGAVVLWRKRAGQWQKCVDRLAEIGGYYSSDDRFPWLEEPSGVWLGVSGGAWWIPHDEKPPVWVNWRRGLSVPSISGLFPLADGSILAYGAGLGSAQMTATPQPILPLPPGLVAGGMNAPKYAGPLFADPRHHLWETRTYFATGPCPLDEWDGKRWLTHLPPPSIPGVGPLYACDTRGRLWLTTTNWHPPAEPQPIYSYAIYDPAHDTWTKYATVSDALQSAAALPGMGFLPHHDLSQPPLFSGDGRVAYVDNNTKILLYDGKTWRHWEAREILPSFQYGNLPDPPHFRQDGILEVALNDYNWDWTPAGGWQQGGAYQAPAYENPVPPGGPAGLWATPAMDNFGVKWFTWQNAVYLAGYGLWAKQSELSAVGSPFRMGYGIEDVLSDPFGRLFFVSRPAGRYDFVVWSPLTLLRPMIAVTPTSEDSVTVRYQAALKGTHWFLWRLNGGAWSEPITDSKLMLTALAHGDYRVEVQALDSRLQRSPSAAAVFSIRVTTNVQIARWVSALRNGTAEAREEAVAGLVKQPDAALPALQATRPTATEDGQWWIDAAIQQIQDQKQPAD